MENVQKTYLAQIDEALEKYVYACTNGQAIVTDAMRYSIRNGGKRVRPMLTLAFCRLCGGEPEKALPFACAVEMIHTYSLIHDDLPCMDDDDLRRGNPACHKQFGECYALLAGDGLLTLAFETLTKASDIAAANVVRAVRVLADCAGVSGMIGGQVIDLLSEEAEPDFALLQLIDRLKTGALIEAAVVLGCIAAGVTDDKILLAAKTYAQNIGLVFQIVDDMLDVTSNSEELGKPVGSDAKNEKVTFVKLLGLEKCRALADSLTQDAVDALQEISGDTEFLETFARKLAVRKK